MRTGAGRGGVPGGGQPGGIMGWGAGGSCTPRPPIRQQTAQETRVITVVFLGLLLDLLAFTLLLPLLPGLLESHGRAHDPLYGSWQRGVDWFAAAIRMPAEKRYNSVLFGGLIGSVFSFLQFLLAPLTGAVSDCLGRRPVMLLSLAGLATSYAVWAASRSFAAFLASRVIGGISKGNVSLSTAIIADLGSPSARGRGMAVIGVAFSLGFTLGPMLGASLPAETVPWLALLFAASDLLFIFCFLPETLPPEKRVRGGTREETNERSWGWGLSSVGVRGCQGRLDCPLLVPRPLGPGRGTGGQGRFRSCPSPAAWQAPPVLPPPQAPSIAPGFRATADLLSPLALLRFSAVARTQDPPAGDRLGSLRRLGLVYFLYLFLFSGLEYTLSFLAHQRFQFSSLQQGKMFFFIGLTMATVQGAYARRISPGREIAAVKRAILLLVPAFVLIGWGLTLPVLGLGLLLYSFGEWVLPGPGWARQGARNPGSQPSLVSPTSCRGRGALPVLRGCQLWLTRAEGHNHGHPAEPGRPGQGGGTHGGCLSVLAGGGQDLLHRVLRPLPAPLPAPVESEASSPRAQGRVAEPAPPRAGGGGGERRPGPGPGPAPPPPPPPPGPAQDGSRPAAPEGPRHSRPLPRCGRPCEAGGSDSKPFQAFCWLL
ncbi:major facilitator superfamily domain-containing protein 10 isoform X3 [Zalophus californianus]|uniref:Major facilitator superfamily domain-containing protein 10 isoform X3 n=1 Tax=Zalophus californianus TaxID=9704 RepID=A0A6J2DGK5_ZALCA|nr:major facilitator superfamily domain-containing protein 10 isoform X3 [Zalophus californianus]